MSDSPLPELFISLPNDETDPGLFLKPIPGQIAAIVEPGPMQKRYAALLVSAPRMRANLLEIRRLCAISLEAETNNYNRSLVQQIHSLANYAILKGETNAHPITANEF